MDWLTKPFEPIFSCMEPQRDGDKADKGRVTLLCAALDCSGTGRGGPKSNKKVVAGRRGMPGVEANNDHTKAMSVDSNDSQDTALPGGVGVVFAAGPIGSGPVVKGIVPGGSADQVGGVLVGDELREINGESTVKLPAVELAGKLIGPVGTTVIMVFARKGEDGSVTTRSVTLTRARRR
uniref:PDZ domain-containing protein n=1 Tax=Hemiselmis andersenii TaxID=464988 RepID=A0A6U4T0V7_HEMAN|mmetsp:Transcript_21330/g.49445  ORF Transcript_21330/g.49445 Transcript_21330/m.49445 type:complete len:179 (+) Transcript_21330:195-731(+)|eukprot:CAMPEP_0114109008 /NCGR_PEP_ID=MMETSP0043_2-20121206/537_1 /TAXON_ID=464988 /ORGANISM="Hemiselmis andersenii, Strain CCMP644" /LENGTH=178 /DNA_ID=CAMNT_0001200837 /DNA_START=105 /DNA_END=641 /DNA_ORIENTATION=+